MGTNRRLTESSTGKNSWWRRELENDVGGNEEQKPIYTYLTRSKTSYVNQASDATASGIFTIIYLLSLWAKRATFTFWVDTKQKLIKNAKNSPFGEFLKNYQAGQF